MKNLLFLFKDEINVINSDGFQKTIRWVKNDFEKKIIDILIIILLVECSSMVNQSITSKMISSENHSQNRFFFN